MTTGEATIVAQFVYAVTEQVVCLLQQLPNCMLARRQRREETKCLLSFSSSFPFFVTACARTPPSQICSILPPRRRRRRRRTMDATFSLFLPPRQHSSPYYSSLFCETVLSAPVVYSYSRLMMMMFTLLECIFFLIFYGKRTAAVCKLGGCIFFPGRAKRRREGGNFLWCRAA